MPFTYIKQMPSVEDIIREIPVEPHLTAIKQKRDKEIKDVIEGKSKKFLVIIGPCSAHDEDALCDYVGRLAALNNQVKDRLILIPRIYTNKPRTTGEGYKGMLHQPNPQEEPDMVAGLKAIRKMHIRALSESHFTAADEMLYPGNYPYLEDVLSYVAIGARSVENQKHRLSVSGLDIPVGMKNPTSGDLDVMLNSIRAAQIPHEFVYNSWQVKTPGNLLVHAVLRGAMNKHGQHIANYHYEDLMLLAERYLKRKLKYPAILVDTNHSNSGKKYAEQPRIAHEIMGYRQYSQLLREMVKGLMIESYIEEGCQPTSGSVYGKSITDPCLGWEDSKRLILEIADRG